MRKVGGIHNKRKIPNAEYLRERLIYDPETGKLFWKPYFGSKRPNSWNAKFAGKEAFTALTSGYKHGAIDNINYLAHLVIWVLVIGEQPPDGINIDHKNGNRTDNRWNNLRLATLCENSRNAATPKNNTSGIKGVYWNKNAKKWLAQIVVNSKRIYLGIYESKDDAALAYKNASEKYHGDFARDD